MTGEPLPAPDLLMRVTYWLRLNDADQKRILPTFPDGVVTQDGYESCLEEAIADHLPDLLDRAIDEPECEAS